MVKRKLPEIYLRSTGVNGQYNVSDPTSTCLITTGTPIADSALGTYSIPFAMVFRMSQLINSTDITNLCDAYKLRYISIGVTYQSTQASVGGTSIMPNLTWVQDHDDGVAPTSVNQLREKMGSKFRAFGFNKVLKIGVQPKVADTIFNTGILNAYAVPKPQWINSTYPDVEHYAIKGVISNVLLSSAASTGFKFDVTTTVYGKDFQ